MRGWRVLAAGLAYGMFLSAGGVLPAAACTLFGAAGGSVAGGGTLIAKNRDWRPDHVEELKVIHVDNGYSYLSLSAVGGGAPGTKAAVNEKGLTVISASPPQRFDKKLTGLKNMRWVLTHYQTVREAVEALQAGAWFVEPEFYMLADATEVAYIEFGPGGERSVRVMANGRLAHTNHYLDPSMQPLNPANLHTSPARYDRITELLGSKEQLTAGDLQAMSGDPVIWRQPVVQGGTQTLSGFQVHHSPTGDVTIWVKIADPGRPAYEMSFSLQQALAGEITFPRAR